MKLNPAVIYFNDFPSKIINMNNWNKNIISFEDFTVILSNKSMIITGIQRNIKSEGKFESRIADILSSISPLALQIEEKIRKQEKRFKLKRIDNGVLSGHIINIELAYEHHTIAETASKNNYNININDNGKMEIWSDKSKGFPELETGGDKAIKNMDLLNENTKFLARNKLEDINNEIKREISNISENINKISDLLYETTKHSIITQDQLDELISSQNRIDKMIEKIIKGVL
jgi:Mg2+ and Co2+ transporter CorA